MSVKGATGIIHSACLISISNNICRKMISCDDNRNSQRHNSRVKTRKIQLMLWWMHSLGTQKILVSRDTKLKPNYATISNSAFIVVIIQYLARLDMSHNDIACHLALGQSALSPHPQNISLTWISIRSDLNGVRVDVGTMFGFKHDFHRDKCSSI